jgi:hypothetical protein
MSEYYETPVTQTLAISDTDEVVDESAGELWGIILSEDTAEGLSAGDLKTPDAKNHSQILLRLWQLPRFEEDLVSSIGSWINNRSPLRIIS